MRWSWTVAVAVLALAAVSFVLPVVARAEGSCPNEQLRVENEQSRKSRLTAELGTKAGIKEVVRLPDCRAYELVTPPFKNGEPPVTNGTTVSTEGNSLTLSSLGAFAGPGNDSTPEGGEYIISRGSSGWVAKAVNPSATEFQDGSPAVRGGVNEETLDYSANLQQTLFLKARRGAVPVDARFYIDSPFSSSFTEVGPMLSPETVAAWSPKVAEGGDAPATGYVGASPDFSHVFFSQEQEGETNFGWLWQGDKTVRGAPGPPSLYEFFGTHQAEPELVGVKNEGTLAAAAAAEKKPRINEAAEQITQCGVLLGGVLNPGSPSSSNTLHAISTTGETAFFTALQEGCTAPQAGETGTGPEVAELYARVNGEKTTAISEPTTGKTGNCESCVETSKKHAVFEGASADGHRVFFLSEQRLFGGTNPENETTLYEYNFDGPAQHKVSEIATGLTHSAGEMGGVMAVSATGQRVYFVSERKLTANLSAAGEEARQSTPTEHFYNLYLFEAGAVAPMTFIVALNEGDQADWSGSIGVRNGVDTTASGEFLVFPSVDRLATSAGEKAGGEERRQLYRYQAPTAGHPAGVLQRVSSGAAGSYVCPTTKEIEAGYNCNGEAPVPSEAAFSPRYERKSKGQFEARDSAAAPAVSVSEDGRVFFESPVALAPGAQSDACVEVSESGTCKVAAENIYEWESGQVYLLSSGHDENTLFRKSTTRLIGADVSGTNVFFTTASPLVAEDTDSQVDVYDARIEGGFPVRATSVACAGECQGPSGAPPLFGAPVSATLTGSANLSPPAPARSTPKKATGKSARCARGKKLSHGKCIRAKHRQRRRHAGKTGGATR